MKLLRLLWLFNLVCPGGCLFSQHIAESNMAVADRLIDEGLLKLRNSMTLLGDEKLFVFKYDQYNPEADYIARRVQTALQGFKVLWGTEHDSSDYSVDMIRPSVKVRYAGISTDNVIGNKRIERIVSVGFDFLIQSSGESGGSDSVSFAKSNRSYVDYESLPSVESSLFPFLRAELPNEGSSSSLLIPAVMIGVSAAAIILFFTIRSK